VQKPVFDMAPKTIGATEAWLVKQNDSHVRSSPQFMRMTHHHEIRVIRISVNSYNHRFNRTCCRPNQLPPQAAIKAVFMNEGSVIGSQSETARMCVRFRRMSATASVSRLKVGNNFEAALLTNVQKNSSYGTNKKTNKDAEHDLHSHH
jgi:hypothetical protein